MALVFSMTGCSILNNLIPGKKSGSESQNNSSGNSSESISSSASSFTPTSDNFNEPDPNAQQKTIGQMLSANGTSNNTTTLYRITGIAQ